MKFVIICKKKAKVHLIEKCNGEELAIVGAAILHESICKLIEERNGNRQEIIDVIKELLDERVFIPK